MKFIILIISFLLIYYSQISGYEYLTGDNIDLGCCKNDEVNMRIFDDSFNKWSLNINMNSDYTNYTIVYKLKKNDLIQVLERKGVWLKVQHFYYIGWIYTEYYQSYCDYSSYGFESYIKFDQNEYLANNKIDLLLKQVQNDINNPNNITNKYYTNEQSYKLIYYKQLYDFNSYIKYLNNCINITNSEEINSFYQFEIAKQYEYFQTVFRQHQHEVGYLINYAALDQYRKLTYQYPRSKYTATIVYYLLKDDYFMIQDTHSINPESSKFIVKFKQYINQYPNSPIKGKAYLNILDLYYQYISGIHSDYETNTNKINNFIDSSIYIEYKDPIIYIDSIYDDYKYYASTFTNETNNYEFQSKYQLVKYIRSNKDKIISSVFELYKSKFSDDNYYDLNRKKNYRIVLNTLIKSARNKK